MNKLMSNEELAARRYMAEYLAGPPTRIKEYLRQFFSDPDGTMRLSATIARAPDIVECIEGMLDRSVEYSADELLSNFVRGRETVLNGSRALALNPATANTKLTKSIQKGWCGLPLIHSGCIRLDGFIPLLTGSHRLASVAYLHKNNLLPKTFRVPVFDLDLHWDYFNSFLSRELNYKALELIGREKELSWFILAWWGKSNNFFHIVTGIDNHRPEKLTTVQWH